MEVAGGPGSRSCFSSESVALGVSFSHLVLDWITCRQLPVLKVDGCLSGGILLFSGTRIIVRLLFLRERNVGVLPCVSALVCTKDLLME